MPTAQRLSGCELSLGTRANCRRIARLTRERSAGNGSQWPRMAAELVETSPAFRASIEACAAALQPYGVDLMAEFAKPDGWSTPALAMSGLSAVQAR